MPGPSRRRSCRCRCARGDLALRFFTTIATLGTPQNITLQELRIECFFPADEVTEEVGRRLAGR